MATCFTAPKTPSAAIGASKKLISVLNTSSIPELDSISSDNELISVRTAKSGFYEALVKAGDRVEAGTPLANIINPYDGDVLETLYAPINSVVFFIHNEPLTYANTVEEVADFDKLIKEADEAMYAVKKRKKSQESGCVLSNPQLPYLYVSWLTS